MSGRLRFPGECNCCGECCEVIISGRTKAGCIRDFIDKAVRDTIPAINHRSLPFMVRHWHRISRVEAVLRAPALTGTEKGLFYYECDAFDKGTRKCTMYDERPPVCSGWPHYHAKRGKTINAGQCPSCVFNDKVPVAAKGKR